jgi:hypothetical protein
MGAIPDESGETENPKNKLLSEHEGGNKQPGACESGVHGGRERDEMETQWPRFVQV